jgi:hypothetical protein
VYFLADYCEATLDVHLLSYAVAYVRDKCKHLEEAHALITRRASNYRLHMSTAGYIAPYSLAYPTCHERVFVVGKGQVCISSKIRTVDRVCDRICDRICVANF